MCFPLLFFVTNLAKIERASERERNSIECIPFPLTTNMCTVHNVHGEIHLCNNIFSYFLVVCCFLINFVYFERNSIRQSFVSIVLLRSFVLFFVLSFRSYMWTKQTDHFSSLYSERCVCAFIYLFREIITWNWSALSMARETSLMHSALSTAQHSIFKKMCVRSMLSGWLTVCTLYVLVCSGVYLCVCVLNCM